MKQKLSRLPSPALAGVVKEKSVRSAIAEIKNCRYADATMIDLHLQCLESTDEASLSKIIASTSLPILALHYPSTETVQRADYSEEMRVESFLRAVRAGAAGIDLQGYTYHIPSKSAFCGEDRYAFTKGNPKEIVTDAQIIARQCELIQQVHAMDAEVLLSCHPGIFMNCEQVVELALFMEARNPDIIKIVTAHADTEEEMIEVFRTMVALKKEVRTPVAYHANGKCGALTRIINPILGGQIAFCVERYKENSTVDQLDLRTAAVIVEHMKKIREG